MHLHTDGLKLFPKKQNNVKPGISGKDYILKCMILSKGIKSQLNLSILHVFVDVKFEKLVTYEFLKQKDLGVGNKKL